MTEHEGVQTERHGEGAVGDTEGPAVVLVSGTRLHHAPSRAATRAHAPPRVATHRARTHTAPHAPTLASHDLGGTPRDLGERRDRAAAARALHGTSFVGGSSRMAQPVTQPPSNRGAVGDDTTDVEPLLDELRGAFRHARQASAQRIAEMSRRMAGLESDLRDMEVLLNATERQASRLANLYVAAYQLHASLDPAEVRGAIGEIAVNLLGAEQCALLLEGDDEAPGHEIIHLAGDAPLPPPFDSLRYLGGHDPQLDAALVDGALRFGPGEGSSALAVVPLVVQGRVIGALVVLRLLPHKPALQHEDRELLDLLAAHAASALLAARVFHETQRKLRTLEGLVRLLRKS
jgi:hypothetical protein